MCSIEWEKMKGSDPRGVIRSRLEAVQNRNLPSVYWCDIWSVRVPEGHKLSIYENTRRKRKYTAKKNLQRRNQFG